MGKGKRAEGQNGCGPAGETPVRCTEAVKDTLPLLPVAFKSFFFFTKGVFIGKAGLERQRDLPFFNSFPRWLQ